jgi:hypothetical protein
MRTTGSVGQTVQAFIGTPAQPSVHRPPGDTEPFGDLDHWNTGLRTYTSLPLTADVRDG